MAKPPRDRSPGLRVLFCLVEASSTFWVGIAPVSRALYERAPVYLHETCSPWKRAERRLYMTCSCARTVRIWPSFFFF